jgi:hypothetical protein
MIDLTVDHVSKRYRVRHTADANGGRRTLRQKLQALRGCSDEFWALRDVSFDVVRGETLGSATIVHRDQPLGTAIDWQSQCLTLRVDQGRFMRGTFYMPHRWQSLPVPPQPEDARQPAPSTGRPFSNAGASCRSTASGGGSDRTRKSRGFTPRTSCCLPKRPTPNNIPGLRESWPAPTRVSCRWFTPRAS